MGCSREIVQSLGAFNQRPSNLRLEITPQGPFEPAVSTLSATPSRPTASNPLFKASPPPVPVAWQWSCHKCGGTFPLGATRRCLYDGHTFCSGFEVNKKTKKVKKNSPCGSVFDYVGWRAWADWREEELLCRTPEESKSGEDSANKRKRDCEHNCTFPSECRWGPLFQDDSKSQQKKSKKQSKSKTTTITTTTTPTASSSSPPSPGSPPSPPSPPSTNDSPKRTSPVSPLDKPQASKQEVKDDLFAKLTASLEQRHATLTAEVSTAASGAASLDKKGKAKLHSIDLGPSPCPLTPPLTPSTRPLQLPNHKSGPSTTRPTAPPTPPLIGLAISPGIETSIPRNIDAPVISPGTEEAPPRSPTFAQTFSLPATSIPIWAIEDEVSLNDSTDITDVKFGAKDPPSPLSETFADLNRNSWYAGDDGCAAPEREEEEEWDWSTGGFRNSGNFGIGLQGEMELVINVDDDVWI